MAATYEPIATTTLGSDTADFTFSSISGSYTDLVLIMNFRNTKSDSFSYPRIQFNGDTASNYSQTALYGNGTSAVSARQSNLTSLNLYEGTGDSAAASIFGPIIVNIMNYSNATTYKTILVRGGSPAGTITSTQVELWRKSPEAITSIKIFDGAGFNIKSGSSFTLYGIASA
jgi:hypothetical protein